MNIKDIAQLAGVSSATVSRVLNGTAQVKEETRRRVIETVEQYRYTPNALARGLIIKRTRTIGVLTVDILNPYYASVIHYLEQELIRHGVTTFLCNTGQRDAEKRNYIQILLENRVDGLVFVGSTFRSDHQDHLLDLAADRLPTVLINGYMEHENISCVLCNDAMGIQLSFDRLVPPVERILFIGTIRTASGRRKLRAFQNNLRQKPTLEGCVILTSDHTLNRLPDKLDRMWKAHRFQGVVASDDLFAHALLSWARSSALHVPENFQVIGYNDSAIATYALPSLSSVNSRMDALGKAGAVSIEKRITGETQGFEQIILEPFLVERETTFPAR